MTQVLDYSLARPDPAQIKAAGYIGVLRYVAPAADAPKIITAAEYAALRAAGLQVALNWEWYANRAAEGAAAGTADAQAALQQANALGYTGAIYFSVDYDAGVADQPAINEYFQACAAVLGLARLGAYAGYWPLSRLFDAGLISYGWQTLAWSGGNREARAHLYQNGAQAFGNGADINDVLKADWTGGSMQPSGPFYKVTTGQNGVPTEGNAIAAAVGLTWQEIVAIPGQDAKLPEFDPSGPYMVGFPLLLPGFPPPAVDTSALQAQLDAANKSLAAEQADNAKLTAQVQQLEATPNDLQSRLEAAQTALETAQQQIALLQAQESPAEKAIAALKAALG